MAISQAALLCLALNVYHEARGEPVTGQRAVASVTINRARANESSVCEEVFKPHQFSWTGPYRRIGKNKRIDFAVKKVKDQTAWTKAKDIAKKTLASKSIKLTATHFHAVNVRPKWRTSKKLRLVAVIGGHKFYTERDG